MYEKQIYFSISTLQVLSWKLYETGEIPDKEQSKPTAANGKEKEKNDEISEEPKSPLDGLDKDTITCMEVNYIHIYI